MDGAPTHPTTALLLIIAAACEPADRTPRGPTIDTLETGTVVVSQQDAGTWAPDEAWTAQEHLRLGSASGDDTLTLWSDVWDIEVDGADRLYVLDRHAKQVRVFESDGSFVRALGREGSGPGEFSNPIGLDWGPEGNLWVVDQRNARYTVFDTAGTVLATHTRAIGGWGYGWVGGFGAGELYEPSFYTDRATSESRRSLIRVRSPSEPVPSDTFPLPRYDNGSFYRIEREGGSAVVGIPFAPALQWRFDRAGGLWFGITGEYRLFHRSLAGDTVTIVERTVESIPVFDDDIALREQFDRFGATHVEAIVARLPATKPAFTGLVVDEEGFLWVARPSDAPEPGRTPFDVFTPSGVFLGTVTAPIGMQPPPTITRRWILGVARDDLDVSYVVMSRIDGRP